MALNLQEERTKRAQSGERGGVGAATGAIVALTKGKGKGKCALGKGASWGAGAGRKGEGRAPGAATPKGDGKKGETFDGYCHYCKGHGQSCAQWKLLKQHAQAVVGVDSWNSVLSCDFLIFLIFARICS